MVFLLSHRDAHTNLVYTYMYVYASIMYTYTYILCIGVRVRAYVCRVTSIFSFITLHHISHTDWAKRP